MAPALFPPRKPSFDPAHRLAPDLIAIDTIHFYVRDAARMRDWSVEKLGLSIIAEDCATDVTTRTHKVGNDRFCLTISAPLTAASPVAEYLQQHPPGVKEIDFCVRSLDIIRQKLDRLRIEILANSSIHDDRAWLKVRGWGAIEHKLIEDSSIAAPLAEMKSPPDISYTGIDHLVLNVAVGELAAAVEWYREVFDFRVQQTFDIHTQNSGLASKALVSACGRVRFNINEPSSPNSQIQEFLDANGGAGIQHIALQTDRIVDTVSALRQQGVTFLPIPADYYEQLKLRTDRGVAAQLTNAELQVLERLKILADWSEDDPDAVLMQIFTQPLFDEPTFFLEIIERRNQAQGFGRGNFQALFEAIESYNERV